MRKMIDIFVSYLLNFPELEEILPRHFFEGIPFLNYDWRKSEIKEKQDNILENGVTDKDENPVILWYIMSSLVVLPNIYPALVDQAFGKKPSPKWQELDEVFASFRELYSMKWWMQEKEETTVEPNLQFREQYLEFICNLELSGYENFLFFSKLISDWYNEREKRENPIPSLIAFLQRGSQSSTLYPWDDITKQLPREVEKISVSWCGPTFIAILRKGNLSDLYAWKKGVLLLKNFIYFAHILVVGNAVTKKVSTYFINSSGNVTLQRVKKKMKIDGKHKWVRKNYFLVCIDSKIYVFSDTGKYIAYSSERIDCTREIKMDIIKDCFLPVIKLKSDGDEWDRVFLTEAGELLPGEE